MAGGFLLRGRRWRIWLALGATGLLLLAACQGTVPDPTATPSGRPTPTPKVAAAKVEAYRQLVDQVFSDIGELTRVLSGIGLQLTSRPEEAQQAAGTVMAVKGILELDRERLASTEPPLGYGEVHQRLVDALSLYGEAAEALLPDEQTGQADHARFQELMLEGGRNTHAAGAALGELRP